MTIRRETYDSRCYDLAEEWLDCEDNFENIASEHQQKLRERLAGDIQGAVEDFDIADDMSEILAKEQLQ